MVCREFVERLRRLALRNAGQGADPHRTIAIRRRRVHPGHEDINGGLSDIRRTHELAQWVDHPGQGVVDPTTQGRHVHGVLPALRGRIMIVARTNDPALARARNTGALPKQSPADSPPRDARRTGAGLNDAARKLNSRVTEVRAGRRGVILWRTRSDKILCADIGPECRHAGIEDSLPIRLEYRYPKRRAHSGEHWFEPVRGHRHFESMAERLAMMQLAYHYNRSDQPTIVAFSSQPMLIAFEDRGVHVPDLMAGFDDGTATVFDVKLRKALTPEQRDIFERTGEVSRRVGWRYVGVLEPERVVGFNIEKLAAYRHPRYAPPPDVTAAVGEFCANGRELGDVADWLARDLPRRAVPWLLYLLWMRVLEPASLTVPLEWDVRVTTATFGQTRSL